MPFSSFEMRRKRRYERLLNQVNRREPEMRRLSDEGVREMMGSFRDRRRRGEAAWELMPEVYALVREAGRRTLGLRQFDVQIMAGMALQDRQTIEMDTGEGKTLVATLVAALQALEHKGVHIVTVNDYLAHRDAEWMRPVFELLGFSVDSVLCDHLYPRRIKAYSADITYGTIRQMGYDFLQQWFETDPEALRRRDPFAYMSGRGIHNREETCLRGRYFTLLDEADSVLIDFARAPLTMTEPASDSLPLDVYRIARKAALEMQRDKHFTVDEGRRKVELTADGKKVAEGLASEHPRLGQLPKSWENRIQEALSAEYIMINGRDYVVVDDDVQLIDDVTGRIMRGQRLGGESHQALEVKENVTVRPRQVIARRITIQALVRGYKHVAGMTGTAWESRREFLNVYKLGVTRFDPNRPCLRHRQPDRIYVTSAERCEAIVEDVAEKYAQGQPVLLGTRTVRMSEELSERLNARNVPHNVLNATHHAEEAEVILGAGNRGSVTVATNMAGRGVDIKLGQGVEELGGLYVVGAERHEVSRFDNQLGGRCARQGDPGTVQYYASLEDDIFRVLGEKKHNRLKRRYRKHRGILKDASVAAKISSVQERIEKYFAELRKNLLKQDEFNEMRDQVIYRERSI